MQGPLKGSLKAIAAPIGAVALVATMTGSVGAAQSQSPSSNSTATIDITLSCISGVTVDTSKDLSNVEFLADGDVIEVLEDLSGTSNTFDIPDDADALTAKAGTSQESSSIDCASGDPDQGEPVEAPEGDTESDDDGSDDGSDDVEATEIEVVFDCESVSVSSSKDISNVVLVFEDASEQKLDGLSGHEGTFSGTGDHDGKVIDAVYVKSGDNASGEGPGYGEHFEASDQDCTTAQASEQ